jgi:hypothetical protein
MRSRLKSIALVCLVACTTADTRRDSTRANDPLRATDSVVAVPKVQNRACGSRLITETGVGDLKLGMTVDSVKAVCRVEFDSVRPGPEGEMERVIGVSYPPDLIEAEILQDTVWRLDIRTAGVTTRDSIAVGSPVSWLLRHGDAQGVIGEGNFVVLFRNRCGISFELSGGIPPGRPHTWTAEELKRLPPTTRVQRILVYRCAPAARASTGPGG